MTWKSKDDSEIMLFCAYVTKSSHTRLTYPQNTHIFQMSHIYLAVRYIQLTLMFSHCLQHKLSQKKKRKTSKLQQIILLCFIFFLVNVRHFQKVIKHCIFRNLSENAMLICLKGLQYPFSTPYFRIVLKKFPKVFNHCSNDISMGEAGWILLQIYNLYMYLKLRGAESIQ